MLTVKSTVICLLTAGLTISGCSGQSNVVKVENNTTPLQPDWVKNPVDYVNPFIVFVCRRLRNLDWASWRLDWSSWKPDWAS